MTTEPWLKKRELAAKLQISVRTIERLQLPHMRVGGQNRYMLSEVEAHLRGEAQRRDNVTILHPSRPDDAA